MEETIISTLATGGPVAILAGIIFFMYSREKKANEDRFAKFIENDQHSREEHTKALTDLAASTRAMVEVVQELKIMLRTQT